MNTVSDTKLAAKYDGVFFDVMDREALRSAQIVLQLLNDQLEIKSVVDVGCGTGVWLRVWRELGCEDVVGVDGEFVDRDRLKISSDQFVAHDLQQPLQLGRRFDLVQSLEVAEHLPAACAEQFVDTLTEHGDLVLFSAALPGQMGVHHVNEQPYGYWRDRFHRRGFCLLDWIRPLLLQEHDVAFWYRYNSFLFARESLVDQLPAAIRNSRLPANAPVPDISPWAYRCRRALVKWLPVAVVDGMVEQFQRWGEPKNAKS